MGQDRKILRFLGGQWTTTFRNQIGFTYEYQVGKPLGLELGDFVVRAGWFGCHEYSLGYDMLSTMTITM